MNTIEIMPNERLRVGLVGFGRTGRAVAEVLLKDQSVDLAWVLRRSHNLEHRSVPEFLGIKSKEDGHIFSIDEMDFSTLIERSPVDAIVDFSSEDGIDYYGQVAADRGITIVSAISKLSKSKISKLKSLATRTRVLWSPNITLGINFLLVAAKTLKVIAPRADISILEEHFKNKPEISGTALKLAAELEVNHDEVKSIRAGGIIGLHEVLFGFPHQTVRLKHESISREAFGSGAIFAVKELALRDPGFHTMEDLVGRYFADANSQYASETKPKRGSMFSRIGSKLRRQ